MRLSPKERSAAAPGARQPQQGKNLEGACTLARPKLAFTPSVAELLRLGQPRSVLWPHATPPWGFESPYVVSCNPGIVSSKDAGQKPRGPRSGGLEHLSLYCCQPQNLLASLDVP